MSNLKTLDFPDGEWNSIQAGGVLALFNGLERCKKYEPESKTVKLFGLVNPQTDCTLAAGTGGSLEAGDYVVTFIEVDNRASQGDGLLSGPPVDSEGQTITVAAGGTITVNLPQAFYNEDANERWIYLSLPGGSWPTLGRVGTVAEGTNTYSITGATEPDFDNYPLDQLRDMPPNKAYPMKMNRRLLLWGGEEKTTVLTFTIGSTEAVFLSGDALDYGSVGMVVYPDEEPRGYVIASFTEGSPYSVTLQDAFVGSNATTPTSNISCKICRPSGEIVWSEPADYENFPAANVRFVELSGSDPETGCAVVNGRGLLLTVQKTFALDFNQTPALGYGTVNELSTAIGCLSHRSIQDIGGVLLWLAEGGIVASQGGAPKYISDEVHSEFDEMVREPTGRCRNAFAVNWAREQKYLLFIPRLGDTVGCSKCICVSYDAVPGEPQFRFTVYTFHKEFTSGFVEQHTTTTADDTNYEGFPILGDKDGFVWSFGIGDADGPSSGTVSGTVTSAASSPEYLTDTAATFYTTGLGLQGMVVTVRRASDATEQHKLIGSNTSNTLYPDTEWDWVPTAGDTFWVGGIDAYYETPWSSLGGDYGTKKLHRIISTVARESSGTAEVDFYTDFATTPVAFTNESNDLALDDTDGRVVTNMSGKKCHYVKFRWHNKKPDMPWTLKNATVIYDGPDEPR